MKMRDGRHEVPAGKVKAIGGLIRRVGLNLVGVHRHLILAVLELSGAAFYRKPSSMKLSAYVHYNRVCDAFFISIQICLKYS